MSINELQAKLKILRDQKRAEAQEKYLKNKFPFLGVKMPLLKKALREFFAEQDEIDWRYSVNAFWKEDYREFHYAALELAIKFKKRAEEEDLSLYEHLIVTNSWWDTVDIVAPHLVGHLLLRFPNLISKTEDWLYSDNFWLQRASLLYQLKWKTKTDEERLFFYCSHLAKEKEFFIRKAIGWALREYSKTNPSSVHKFIENTPLSPLSLREAKKYLMY